MIEQKCNSRLELETLLHSYHSDQLVRMCTYNLVSVGRLVCVQYSMFVIIHCYTDVTVSPFVRMKGVCLSGRSPGCYAVSVGQTEPSHPTTDGSGQERA